MFFFHDETIFQANEDEKRQWGLKGTQVMVQKSKGKGIMVSDFVSEDGFLQLSDVSDVTDEVQYSAREQLEQRKFMLRLNIT